MNALRYCGIHDVTPNIPSAIFVAQFREECGYFRLQDFWPFGRLGDGWVMAAISLPGWFDDSDGADVAALGGCVGTDAQWKIQDEAWNTDVLRQFGLTYMHMKEVRSGDGEFAQFKNSARSLELSRAIIGTFKKSGVKSFGSSSRLKDLRRFNGETNRGLSAYPLNIYSCMFMVKQAFRQQLVGGARAVMNLDRARGTTQAAETANHYAGTDPNMRDVFGVVLPSPLPKLRQGESHSRKTPALQAADFVAWEIRKDIELHRDFWDARPDGEKNQDLRVAHTDFVLAQNRDNPWFRGSMRVFVHELPVLIWRWTYNVIRQMDAARGGVWTDGQRKRLPPEKAPA